MSFAGPAARLIFLTVRKCEIGYKMMSISSRIMRRASMVMGLSQKESTLCGKRTSLYSGHQFLAQSSETKMLYDSKTEKFKEFHLEEGDVVPPQIIDFDIKTEEQDIERQKQMLAEQDKMDEAEMKIWDTQYKAIETEIQSVEKMVDSGAKSIFKYAG